MKNQEKQEFQKLVFDEAKFPHLTNVKDSVEQLTSYIEKLNKRKLLINNQQEMKSEFQKKPNSFYPTIVDPCHSLSGLVLLAPVAGTAR